MTRATRSKAAEQGSPGGDRPGDDPSGGTPSVETEVERTAEEGAPAQPAGTEAPADGTGTVEVRPDASAQERAGDEGTSGTRETPARTGPARDGQDGGTLIPNPGGSHADDGEGTTLATETGGERAPPRNQDVSNRTDPNTSVSAHAGPRDDALLARLCGMLESMQRTNAVQARSFEAVAQRVQSFEAVAQRVQSFEAVAQRVQSLEEAWGRQRADDVVHTTTTATQEHVVPAQTNAQPTLPATSSVRPTAPQVPTVPTNSRAHRSLRESMVAEAATQGRTPPVGRDGEARRTSVDAGQTPPAGGNGVVGDANGTPLSADNNMCLARRGEVTTTDPENDPTPPSADAGSVKNCLPPSSVTVTRQPQRETGTPVEDTTVRPKEERAAEEKVSPRDRRDKISNTGKVIRAKDLRLRARRPWLTHQRTLGIGIVFTCMVGQFVAGGTYFNAYWGTATMMLSMAVIRGILGGHSSSQGLHCKKSAVGQVSMRIGRGSSRLHTNPWFRRVTHPRHYSHSGERREMVECLSGLGLPFARTFLMACMYPLAPLLVAGDIKKDNPHFNPEAKYGRRRVPPRQ